MDGYWIDSMIDRLVANGIDRLMDIQIYKLQINMDIYTGCPDQIGRNLKITLLPNQKSCRKCKVSFGIVRNRAIKYTLQ